MTIETANKENISPKDEIKKVLSESKDMVGEKSQKEGIFHKIFRGYVPLNLLSNLKLEPDKEKKTRIDAYCDLLQIALRKSISSLGFMLKGYGINTDEIHFRQTALYEYEQEKRKIEENETRVRDILLTPDPALKNWFDELKVTRDLFLKPIVDPYCIDQNAYIPTEVLAIMSRLGLFRLKVPKKYGGLGFSQKEYDLVLRTLSHISGTLLAAISAHSTIGSAPLMLYGTEEQKENYLRQVAEGNFLFAFGLTEPDSGTDAIGKMKSTARLSEDKNHWIINGEKIYITNAHRAGLMYVMAKTDFGKGLSIEEMKPTVFIVELPFTVSDSPEEINKKRHELAQKGLLISEPLDLMMIRGSNQAYITFKNFKVPANNVLGEIEGGTKVIFNSLNKGRAAFGASSAEASRVMFESALRRTITREMFKVFGGKQSDLPQVKKYLSRMVVSSCALRAISDMTSAVIDEYGHEMNLNAECAAIKVLGTEGAFDTAIYALRLWGGTGTMRGHAGTMELFFRDAWIGIIVEGVNEAIKQLVAGVGVQAVKDDADTIARHFFVLIKPFGKKSETQKKKKKHKLDFFRLFIPACFRLVSGLLHFEAGKLNFLDALWIQFHTKLLSIKTALLGLKYGNNMVVRQLELIRMADIVMDIYSLTAVLIKLKVPEDTIPTEEKAALKSFVRITKEQIKKNLSQLKINNKEDKEDIKIADLWISVFK